jgi:Fe-S-cluster containining protein
MEQEFPPNHICPTCGECCKRYSGAYHPEDFGVISEKMLMRKLKKDCAIDWLEGEMEIYFVRPRHKNTDYPIDPSWGGECIHLTSVGCNLERHEMPSGCRLVKPKEIVLGKCEGPGKETAAIWWEKYQRILISVKLKLENK